MLYFLIPLSKAKPASITSLINSKLYAESKYYPETKRNVDSDNKIFKSIHAVAIPFWKH